MGTSFGSGLGNVRGGFAWSVAPSRDPLCGVSGDGGAAALGGSTLGSAAYAGGDDAAPPVAITVTTRAAVVRRRSIVIRFLTRLGEGCWTQDGVGWPAASKTLRSFCMPPLEVLPAWAMTATWRGGEGGLIFLYEGSWRFS